MKTDKHGAVECEVQHQLSHYIEKKWTFEITIQHGIESSKHYA